MKLESRRGRRRRELGDAGFPPAWRDLLERRMQHWSLLDDDERRRLEERALDLVVDKHWEAARGFELTEDVVVTIAAQAALLVLGLADDAYRNVHTIIVQPTTVVLTGERARGGGLATDEPVPILGQASYGGPVVIVWDAVLEEARHPGRGHNVVYHEFAHKLDMLDGLVDGTPPMADREQQARWVEVCTAAYERVRRGEGGSALRPYAGVNPAEFFAVATEVFFDDPLGLRHEEPDLYDVLADFYRQDPAARADRPQAPAQTG